MSKKAEAIKKRQDEIREKIRNRRRNPQKTINSDTMECLEVKEMAAEYAIAMGEYKYKSKRTFYSPRIEKGTGLYTTLARAVKFAKELNVDFSTYVKAIFYVADKMWNRAPKTWELVDYKTKIPAKDRVRAYLSYVEQDKTIESRKVTGAAMPMPTVPQELKSINSERQLRAFMENYNMSAEDVFKKFARGADSLLYFDHCWLMSHPVYLKLLENGEV